MDSINIRMPDEMKIKLSELAKKQERSLSNYLVLVLKDYLHNIEEEEDHNE